MSYELLVLLLPSLLLFMFFSSLSICSLILLTGNIPTESDPAPTSQPTSTTEESKTQEREEEEEDEKEEVDEQEEEEKIEGVEPNVNRMYDPGMSAEAKQAGGGKKKAHRGGGSKSRTKRGVFRDADGHSTLEKTNEVRGTVTVIGEGTIFSEKALPPQAKFVVYPVSHPSPLFPSLPSDLLPHKHSLQK